MKESAPLAVGIDESTQGVKALALGPDGIEAVGAVSFAKDLPQFGAPEGFAPDPDPAVRRAPPRMWEEGIRLALARLGEEVDLGRAGCVAGSAQQHGLVLADAAGEPLQALAPIWMDRSTAADCAALEARFGAALREKTGSAATERFTGPQARRAAREDPAAWTAAAHVQCVATWLEARLVGDPAAPCDPGSASGQNLMDLAAGGWDGEIASFTAPGLPAKLPRIVPSSAVAGALAPAFAVGGLRAGMPALVWSGDNPDSLLGMGVAAPGEAVVSLGTSDTFFAAMEAPRTDPAGFGNVFCTSAGGFMSLSCFTNGALARDRVRRERGLDWAAFDRAHETTAPWEGGRLLLPWFAPESVTGGGAKSPAILRVLADVFQAPVERIESAETVALGAAMRAWSHLTGEPLAALAARLCRPAGRVAPDPAAAPVYAAALAAYEAFEKAER